MRRILARFITKNQGPKKWVAYLAAAANVSRPLPNRLKGLNPPVINPRIRFCADSIDFSGNAPGIHYERRRKRIPLWDDPRAPADDPRPLTPEGLPFSNLEGKSQRACRVKRGGHIAFGTAAGSVAKCDFWAKSKNLVSGIQSLWVRFLEACFGFF